MAEERWYFTKEQLINSPSKKCGLEPSQESLQRQQAANLIQDMGQKLLVSQLCINTAIVYMHRFYAFHSFTLFHRNQMAAASLFLAAKVEEQPRKLEHVIKAMNYFVKREGPPFDPKSKQAINQMDDLAFNENILLQTLGFDVAIDHPHTHVVKTCHLVRAPKDLTQTSYFMASNSLHKTTMCLQYKPSIVACFCIHVACKWSSWQIPQSKEGKHWYEYVDSTVTGELLDQLTLDFLHHFDRNRAKTKLMPMEMPLGPSNSNESTQHREPRQSEQTSRHSVPPGTAEDHKHRSSSSRHSHSQSLSQSSTGSQPGPSQGHSSSQSQSSSHGHTSSQGPHQNTHQGRNNDINVIPQHNQSSGTTHNHHKSSQNNSGSHQSHNLNSNAPNPYDNQSASYTSVQPREYRDQNKRAEERALLNANKNFPQQQGLINEHRSSSSNAKRSSADASHQKHRIHNQVDPSGQNPAHLNTNKDQVHYAGNTRERQGHYNPSETEYRAHSDNSNRDVKPDITKLLHKQDHKSRPTLSNSASENKDSSSISKSFSSKQPSGSHDQRSKPLTSSYAEPKLSIPNSYNFDEPNKTEFVKTPPKQTKISSLFSPDGIDPPAMLMKKIKQEPKTTPNKSKHSPKDKRDRKYETQKKPERKSHEPIIKTEKIPYMPQKIELNNPGISAQGILPSVSKVPSPGEKSKQKSSKHKSRESNVPLPTKSIEDRLFGDCTSTLVKLEQPNMRPPSSDISTFGIETNTDMISSLLKENLFEPAEQSQFDYSTFNLPGQPPSPSPESICSEPVKINDTIHTDVVQQLDLIQTASTDASTAASASDSHKHKSEKKKKKEKHKHKDKEKDRSRDDRKKHKKDKDRHRDKKEDSGIIPAGPLKITIPKDKILEKNEPSLKIKIPKDRLSSVPSNESKVGLKIKIPKEVIEYNSKKRDRDRSSDRGPPSKNSKLT